MDEIPNVDAARFFKLLKDFNEPLVNGCTNHSKFLIIARVFTIKLNYSMSEVSYDSII